MKKRDIYKSQIDIEEVLKLLQKKQFINLLPFEKIQWFQNGKRIRLTEEEIKEWKFIGLTNTDWVRTHFMP